MNKKPVLIKYILFIIPLLYLLSKTSRLYPVPSMVLFVGLCAFPAAFGWILDRFGFRSVYFKLSFLPLVSFAAFLYLVHASGGDGAPKAGFIIFFPFLQSVLVGLMDAFQATKGPRKDEISWKAPVFSLIPAGLVILVWVLDKAGLFSSYSILGLKF